MEDHLRPAMLTKKCETNKGMLLRGGMPLIIHIVQEAGYGVKVNKLLCVCSFKAEALGLEHAVRSSVVACPSVGCDCKTMFA